MIEYRNIHKSYDRPVLRGVSLTVFDSEIVSLVGSSGTGKSVFLKTTNGLVAPDEGDVLIDGVSVVTASASERSSLRQKIGYVFQYAALFDSMSVYENVLEGLSEETLRLISEAEAVERVERALSDVRLNASAILDKFPSELSGGMKKRVGIARAMIGAPAIMIYDEPVTGLDPVTSAAVSRLLVEIARAPGRTTLVVTHDVEGALEWSDRVGLLDAGRLRFLGTPYAFRNSSDPLVRAFADRDEAMALSSESEEG